ncbi:plasmid pRiA4b ORF-3 family protein [Arthrobacter sp. Sr24]
MVSLADAVAARALAPVLPGFKIWMTQAGVDAEEVDWLISLLQDFFKNYAQSVQAPDATNLEVDMTSRILDSAGGFHPEMRKSIALALNSYVKFLMTTQAWTGTGDDLIQLITMTSPEETRAANAKYAQRVFRQPQTAELAAESAAELVFVRRVGALLDWIGEGRKTTPSGLLPRKDIQGAAACVEVEAVGAATRSTRPGDGEPNQVTSMTQVPRLMEYWQVLTEAELIQVDRQRVKLTGHGQRFQSDPDHRARYAAILAYYFLYDALVPYDDSQPENPVRTQVAGIIAAAASGNPPQTSEVFGQGPATGPEKFTAMFVEERIRDAAANGLVEIDTHIIVPPVLRHAVEELLGLLDKHIAKQSRLTRGPSQATFQLKIQIDGITPGVWRRVTVPAELGLDELHEIIQNLFAWNETHLHEFMLGTHPNVIRYAPDDPEAEHLGDPPADEEGVALNTLLHAPKDTLLYTYDFGDNWEHTITLEKILPAKAPGILPLCVAGSGHPPQEDSFGPHGWMEKLATSRNPSDPDHANIRSWLGLRKGQHIDPTAFDPSTVNKQLGPLRTMS